MKVNPVISMIPSDELSGPVRCRDLVETLASVPRKIPRDIREEMAFILVSEIIDGVSYQIKDSGKFTRRYGIFYPLFLHLRHSELWYLVKGLAVESLQTAIPITQLLVSKIFDLIDQFAGINDVMYADLDEKLKALLAEFDSSGSHLQIHPSPLPYYEEISHLIAELTRLAALLTSGQAEHSEAIEMFQKACQNAIQRMDTILSDHRESDKPVNSEEIHKLLEDLQAAIDDLTNETPEAIPEGSKTPPLDIGSEPGGSADGKGGEQEGGSGQAGGPLKPGGAGQGEGIGTGDNSDSFSSPIREAIHRLQDLRDLNSWQQVVSSENEENLWQAVLQKAVYAPVHSMIQSCVPEQKSIRYLSQIFPGDSWGLDVTSLKHEDIGNLEKIAHVIETSTELKEILKHIGRARVNYGVKSYSLSPMGRSEMYSITRSGDISRLLPTESVKFNHPILKRKIYADFTEGKLLTYNLRGCNWAGGKPKKKRGPVVALIDTSGSMNGFPATMAKAIVLALARKMHKQERDVKVILFSGPGNTHEIELLSNKKMAREFLKFLTSSFVGGTDYNTALNTGLVSLKQPAYKGADLLFITDGVSEISNRAFLNEWRRTKKEQDARVFSFIIGSPDAGGLVLISDYTYFIQDEPLSSESDIGIPTIRFIASPNNPKR